MSSSGSCCAPPLAVVCRKRVVGRGRLAGLVPTILLPRWFAPSPRGTRPAASVSAADTQATPTGVASIRREWDGRIFDTEGWVVGYRERAPGDGDATRPPEVWPASRSSYRSAPPLDSEGSLYRVLEVPPTADFDEIKTAYRKLSKLYHPDSTQMPVDDAQPRFIALQAAYDVLSDGGRRRAHDDALSATVTSRGPTESIMGSPPAGGVSSGAVPYSGRSRVAPGTKLYEPIDGIDGRNRPIGDQASAALGFDVIALVIALTVIGVGIASAVAESAL